MQCPHDQSVLVMSERKGIEIDYCPQCRGVWLDRGELDKIIERSLESEIAAEARGPLPPAPASYDERRYDERRYDDRRYDEKRYDDRRYDDGYRKRKKKDSFLGDLFDF